MKTRRLRNKSGHTLTSGEETDSSDNEKKPHLREGSLLDFLRTSYMQSNVVTGPTQKILVVSTNLLLR